MPRPHSRRRTPLRAVLAALALTARRACSPGPRGNRLPRERRRHPPSPPPTSAPGGRLRPVDAGRRDPRTRRTRSGSSRSTPRCRTERWSLLFLPGTYGTDDRAAADQGRLLHRGRRPRRVAVRRGDQRQGRGLQPLPDRRPDAALLRRAQQLLALAVQPHDRRQRRRPGRLPRLGELLGDLAGVLAAPRRHPRRQPLADGLLHRGAAVRQRRLPRRLARRRRSSTDRSSSGSRATARSAPGPTACGTRSSPAPSARRPRRTSRPSPTRRSTARRSAARSPSSTSATTAPGRCGCRPLGPTRAAPTGPPAPPPVATCPLSSFHVASPDRLGRASCATPLARGKNLLLTPGVYDVDRSLVVRRDDTVVLGMGQATLTAVGGAVPLVVRHQADGVVLAGVTVDAGTGLSPTLMHIGQGGSASAEHRRPHPRAPRPPRRSTTSTSASVARTSAAPTSHCGSTPTTCSSTTRGCGAPTTASRASPPEPAATPTAGTPTSVASGLIVNGDRVTRHGPVRRALPGAQHHLERRGRRRRALPERAPLRPAHAGRLDPTGRHARLGGLQGRRRRAAPPALRRRGLRLQPQRPLDHHRERLRGAGPGRGAAAPRPDRQPRRRQHRARRQRHGRPRRQHRTRRAELRGGLPGP